MKEDDASAEIVVEVGAEGGSLTLFRRALLRGGYEYFTHLNAMGFEDVSGHQELSGTVPSLEEAFALLDAVHGCDWHRLHALAVHPDHAADVLRAVESRLQRDRSRSTNAAVLDRWRRRCGASSDD